MSKGTTKRPIRIEDELWAAVRSKAESGGTNASEVIRQLLVEWLEDVEAFDVSITEEN